jgi:pimeloyl-ACP methyl ester carboxylesterase
MFRPSLACVLSLLTGCATAQQSPDHYRAAAAPTAFIAAVVFVANGAGDSRAASQNLSKVVAETAAPLQIETYVWSLGYKRVVADEVDHDNHMTQGRGLAGAVLAYRHAYPERRICLLGQSAGGIVALSAAEVLPPDSIDRIILLSPSVCTGHDLRPALAASREGIDLFYSEQDRWVLGLGMRIVGTTEEDCRVAAGRVGFIPIINNPTDAALYARLRQHPWDPSLKRTGHDGGHYGNLDPRFLRVYVLPLLGGLQF